MKAIRELIVLGVLLLAIPLATAAQGATQTIDLGDGIEIVVPASWSVEQSEAGIFTATGDDLTLEIYTPANITALGIELNATDALDALAALSIPISQVRTTRDEMKKVALEARMAATLGAPADNPDQLLAAVPLGDDAFGYLQFSALPETLSAAQDVVNAIIASFDVADAATTAPASAATGEPCTVSVATANTAALRVGPGENRSSIAFLPANADVTVTGRNELDDGSVWFQLDKVEAAPNGTAAAELWVNEDDVETSGDCDQVGETSAPPVIPISVAPPAASPAPGEPAPAPAQPGALPAPGSWTLTLDSIMNASCLGYDNVSVATAEIYTSTSWGGNLGIVNNGTFNFDGDNFQRIGSSNSFAGTIRFNYTEGGTTDTQVRFDLISPTSMSGQIVDNYTYDGTPCSDTVTFTFRHN